MISFQVCYTSFLVGLVIYIYHYILVACKFLFTMLPFFIAFFFILVNRCAEISHLKQKKFLYVNLLKLFLYKKRNYKIVKIFFYNDQFL